MARIRSIKPEFFAHEKLFDLEASCGLPVRLAFAGLWTVADREGRFKWRPRTIKKDVLPYDDVDFSAILNALEGAGFVRRYEVDGEEYGLIPAFNKHQHINTREAQSTIPAPPDACTETHVHARGELEGKGKEEEGKEEGGAGAQPDLAWQGRVVRLKRADYDRWRKAYPRIPDFDAALQSADDYYAENPPADGKWFFPASGWLKRENERAIKSGSSSGGDSW